MATDDVGGGGVVSYLAGMSEEKRGEIEEATRLLAKSCGIGDVPRLVVEIVAKPINGRPGFRGWTIHITLEDPE